MSKHLSILILSAVIAAPALAQEPAAGNPPGVFLRRARIDVRPQSAARAEVTAAYEIDGSGPVALLVPWFEGQSLEVSSLRVDGAEVPATRVSPRGGAVRRLGLQLDSAAPDATDSHSIYLTYTVGVPEDRLFRYPVPVPEARSHPEGQEVAVEVLLPPGARFGGDGFPGFSEVRNVEGSERLRAQLASVPAFVHVVFGPASSAWPVPRRLQAGALLLTFLPVLLWGWSRWRLQRRSSVSSPSGSAPGSGRGGTS